MSTYIPERDPLRELVSAPKPLESTPLKSEKIPKSKKSHPEIPNIVKENITPASPPSLPLSRGRLEGRVSDPKKLSTTFEISQIQNPKQLLDLIEKDATIINKISPDKINQDFLIEAIMRNEKVVPLLNEKEWMLITTGIEQRMELQDNKELLHDNKKFMMRVLKRDVNLIRFASEKIQEDQEVISQVLKQDGRAIQFASHYLFVDPLFDDNFYLLKEAVNQNYHAMEFVNTILSDLIEKKDSEWELLGQKGKERTNINIKIESERWNQIISDLIEVNPKIIGNLREDLLKRSGINIDSLITKYPEMSVELLGRQIQNKQKDELQPYIINLIEQNPDIFNYLDESIKNDEYIIKHREIILERIEKEGNVEALLSEIENVPEFFATLSENLRNDRSFILESVKRNGNVIKYIPSHFFKDMEIISTAFNHPPNLGQLISDNDEELMREIILTNPMAIQYASLAFQEDIELMEYLFQIKPEVFQFFNDVLKNSLHEEIIEFFNPHMYNTLTPTLQNNINILRNVFENDIELFKTLDSDKQKIMKDDFERELRGRSQFEIIRIVRGKPELYEFLPEKWQMKNIIIINAIRENPKIYETLPIDKQNNKKIALETVKKDGEMLEEVGKINPNYLSDEVIVLLAIKQNPYSLRHASMLLRGDEAFMEKVININARTFQYASEDIRMNMRVAMMALRKDSKSFHQVHPTLKQNYDFIAQALLVDPLLLAYIEDPVMKDRLVNDEGFMNALQAKYGYKNLNYL